MSPAARFGGSAQDKAMMKLDRGAERMDPTE